MQVDHPSGFDEDSRKFTKHLEDSRSGMMTLTPVEGIDYEWKEKFFNVEEEYLGRLMPVNSGSDASGDWELIESVVDSGAVGHVMSRHVAPQVAIQDTVLSRKGGYYLAANGTKIYNEGQKSIQGFTENGKGIQMTYQVADVKSALNAVGKICDAGQIAMFAKHGGKIIHEGSQAGREIIDIVNRNDQDMIGFTRDDRGVYKMKTWIKKGGMASGRGIQAVSFANDEIHKCTSADF